MASVSLAPLLVAAIFVSALTLEAPQAMAARALTAATLEEVPKLGLQLLRAPLQSSHWPTSEPAALDLSSEEAKEPASDVDGLAMGITREPDSQPEWPCCRQYEASSSVSSDLQKQSGNAPDYLMPEPDYPTWPLGPVTSPQPPAPQLPFLPPPPPAQN